MRSWSRVTYYLTCVRACVRACAYLRQRNASNGGKVDPKEIAIDNS